MVVPPGYQQVTVGEHTVFAEPGEAVWVNRPLGEIKPPAKPNISPADVIKALPDKRAALAKQVATDLALTDDRSVGEFLDAKLIPTLKKLQDFRPPVYFLVTTQNKLKDLTKAGWGEPRYHYNGVADAAAYDSNISYTIASPMDDVVLPAFYTDTMATDARTKGLTAFVQDFDGRMAAVAANQINPGVFSLFVEYLRERHLDTLKLRRDQQWLVMGISNYLAVKYTNVVTGARATPCCGSWRRSRRTSRLAPDPSTWRSRRTNRRCGRSSCRITTSRCSGSRWRWWRTGRSRRGRGRSPRR